MMVSFLQVHIRICILRYSDPRVAFAQQPTINTHCIRSTTSKCIKLQVFLRITVLQHLVICIFIFAYTDMGAANRVEPTVNCYSARTRRTISPKYKRLISPAPVYSLSVLVFAICNCTKLLVLRYIPAKNPHKVFLGIGFIANIAK